MRRWAAAAALVLVLSTPAAANHPFMAALLTIDPDSLQRLSAAGQPLAVIDVRPEDAYRGGRLPGARSIPLPALVPRRGEIPGSGLVVLYGDGAEDAATAYRYLRRTGQSNVFVLEGGYAAWQAKGYRVER
ncbi:MAG TPA: rhodanese-like domain-containing protein [Methylomirabilota bacterium]|nr:rhodanese-like domain-containing protein [Methylomirabilota bacterium]